MDLSMIHDLAAFVAQKNLHNVPLSPVPPEACKEYTKRLLASPGKKNAWAYDAVMDIALDYFKTIWHAIASAARPLFCELYLYDDMPDRYIRREEYQNCTEDDLIDIVTSLSKRLLDWAFDLSTGQIRKHRIHKALQAQELLGPIKVHGPREWISLVPQIRHHIFEQPVPKEIKKTDLTVLHALLAMCVETILYKPLMPLEESIVDHLKPSRVFANDFSEGTSVQESFQQDLDFLSTAFSTQTHAIAAFTRQWHTCLETMHDRNMRVPNMKRGFDRTDVKSSKDYVTMWRNFLTEVTWSWSFVRYVVQLFETKNLKEWTKILNTWYCFCMNEGLTSSLQTLANAKCIPKECVPELMRLADITMNVAQAFVTFAENFFKTRGLREKFYCMDYITTVQTCENPQASCTPQSHNGFILCELPQKWTVTDMPFEGLEGCDLAMSVHHTRLQTRLALLLFQDLHFVWNLLIDTSLWKNPIKVIRGTSSVMSTFLESLPTGSSSVLQNWMESNEDRLLMKKTFQKVYKEAENILIEQWASMIESS